MRDQIGKIINESDSREKNINLVREYLQKYILYILYRKKIYHNLVFTGGTCLRLLYGLRRFSEDLDFSLSYQQNRYSFKNMVRKVSSELENAGYSIDITYNLENNVQNVFFKFKDLLYPELTDIKKEKISIKLKVDSNPPIGGNEESDMVNFEFIFHVKHYDITSLFAGKIHAIMFRKFHKGRDFYDLIWYLTKFEDIKPNFKMLKAAILQTEGNKIEINKNNWKKLIKEKIQDTDFLKISKDVELFLENPEEAELITKENIFKLLS
ncbi:MAG: nucleotidyl transferase AbiEii/AbiGii toxin family protein [Actinomycetota bacterium]